MSRRYNNDLDLEDMQSNNNDGDREISLGATTILGIFFALALVCAVVFGFGYSMGRRSAQPLSTTAPSTTTEPAQSTLDTPKPSPGSLAPAPNNDTAASTTQSDAQPDAQPDTQPDASASQPPTPVARPVALSRTAAPATYEPVVQVAAVSHKEDATILISALKKRGYTASIRQEPQDKLLHVQLGPFPSKTAADAMRDHLLSDGYNAIVK